MQRVKPILALFKDTITAYIDDKASIFAAGLAYFATFSVAPLLVILVWVTGPIIGRTVASDQLLTQIQKVLGPELAAFIGGVFVALDGQTLQTSVKLLSIAGMLVGASGIFSHLRNSLNAIWGITQAKPQTMGERFFLLQRQLIRFGMIFFFGLMLILSVIADTILQFIEGYLVAIFPNLMQSWPELNRSLLVLLTFITFTAIYQLLPDAKTRWRDVAVGALLATLLFTISRLFLNIYLAFNNTVSLYGAAGSVVILMIWVYFSASILLLGAEFIKLYTTRYGEPIEPARMALIMHQEEPI